MLSITYHHVRTVYQFSLMFIHYKCISVTSVHGDIVVFLIARTHAHLCIIWSETRIYH